MKTLILVTGATGFIGSSLIKKLSRNKKYLIYAVYRRSFKFKNSNKIIPIFFNKKKDFNKKLKKIRPKILINLSAFYSTKNDNSTTKKLVNANILFPTLILNLINKEKIKKIINFGTAMQHEKGMKYNPKNLYAATKKAFEEILFFYKKKIFKNTKFFNLKFFETYASNDNRNKLVPIIIKNYKNKKITKIISSQLQLNFIHVDDIIKAIIILIEKNINSGEYLIKAKKDTNIFRLINHYNKNKNKKIYYSILSKNKISVDKPKIRKLPYWKQTRILEKDFKTLIYD